MTSVVSLTMTLALPYGLLGTFATWHARPAVRRTATGAAISVLIALAVPPGGQARRPPTPCASWHAARRHRQRCSLRPGSSVKCCRAR